MELKILLGKFAKQWPGIMLMLSRKREDSLWHSKLSPGVVLPHQQSANWPRHLM